MAIGWEKIRTDVVYMPLSAERYGLIVFARDDLSGWVEALPLLQNNAWSVAMFLYEDVICQHFANCYGPKMRNIDVTSILMEDYNIHQVFVSAYHLQTNGLVERGHDSIINALSKCSARSPAKWPKYFLFTLRADRALVRESHLNCCMEETVCYPWNSH